MESAVEPNTPSAPLPHLRPGRRRRPLVPAGQRKRVRAACLPCRSNKLKCDGDQPCKRCQKTSSPCHFIEPTALSKDATLHTAQSEREGLLEAVLRKHHIDVPSDLDELRRYADTLSAAISNPGLQSGSSSGKANSPVHGLGNQSQDFIPQAASTINPTGSQGDNAASRERAVSDDSSVVVEHAPASQTYVHDQSRTFFDGGFSAWAFFDSVHKTIPGDNSNYQASRRWTTAYRHFIAESPVALPGDLRSSLLAALPPRNVLDFLSATFFRYSQSNFFWVHPAIFTRKLDAFLGGTHEFDPQSKEMTRRPIEFVCVLFMVLALGSQYADLECAYPCDTYSPSANADKDACIWSMDPARIQIPVPSRNPGWRFYQVSRRLLADVVSSCSMTSIQACALQGAFLITTSAHDIAYNLWGLAVRMSVNMGLHRSFGGDVLHPHVRELRNRLWWSIYTLDRLFGFWMGRPTTFDDKEIDAPYPQDLAELRTKQPTGSVDGQIALIKLCRIMDSIIKSIYPHASPRGESLVINMDAFVGLQDALAQWKTQLPEALKLGPSSTRGAVHLHLCHQHAVMLLTRTALSHAAVTKASNTLPQQQRYKAQFLDNAAMDCIQAAQSTIQLLKGLRERDLLCRYSCHDPLFCIAALCVLLLGVKIVPPDREMKVVIVNGLSILRHLGEGSETAASSMGDIIRGFQPFFQASSSVHGATLETRAANTRAEGRRAWVSWMQHSPATTDSPMLSTRQTDVPFQDIPPSSLHDDPGPGERGWTNQDHTPALKHNPGSQEQATLPDYQYLAFDPLMDTWTGGHPFWFSDLETTIEGFRTLDEPFQ